MPERVALIPGGARGIGRALAGRLASEGWSVAIAYRTSAADAEATLAALRAAGARALALASDVSRPEDCAELVRRTTAELGPVSALVQCAGPYRRVPLLEESVEGWRAMLDGNLDPLFHLARLLAPGMIERGHGRIVAFSIAGAARLVGQPMVTGHVVAKTALLVLARSLAKVLAPHGITVNTVSPGFVDTGSAPLDASGPLAAAIERIPAGRVGVREDVVSAVRFLLSDEARYVNGADLVVSGGWGV